jgi:hypothetical protein
MAIGEGTLLLLGFQCDVHFGISKGEQNQMTEAINFLKKFESDLIGGDLPDPTAELAENDSQSCREDHGSCAWRMRYRVVALLVLHSRPGPTEVAMC